MSNWLGATINEKKLSLANESFTPIIALPNSSTSVLFAMEWIIATVPHAFPIVCFMKYTLGLTS